MKKTQLGLMFGGRSPEHEISLLSAGNVFRAIDRAKFDLTLIGIDKRGRWHLQTEEVFSQERSPNEPLPSLPEASSLVTLIPNDGRAKLVSLDDRTFQAELDVIFPVLHGSFGEDGCTQGFLELSDVAFVGPGVLSSAACMDKELAKRLLQQADISVADFMTVRAHEERPPFSELQSRFGETIFVKPAQLGSSVGVRRVMNDEQYQEALALAFQYDSKVLIEKAVIGRELECAVLGNEAPQASVFGEIIPNEKYGFYSYDSKYIDAEGAKAEVPANLEAAVSDKLRQLACRVFSVLECEGLARVDLFLTDDGEAVVNEVNTLPGFTSISMYPQLWEHSGVSYPDLIERLISLALDRKKRQSALKRDF